MATAHTHDQGAGITRAAILAGAVIAQTTTGAHAQDTASQDLAQTLANPIASLIQVPFQQNFDFGYGLDGDGWKATTNVQPVIPMEIGRDWNLVSRTIVPIVYQEGLTGAGKSQFGLGDTVQSLFLSPRSTASGIIWGAGPVFLLPTATDRALGTGKWGIGPTAVVLKQSGQWTIGALANHIWSFAGRESRRDVSATFVQPFLSYATKGGTSYGLNTEITYDWRGDVWLVPLSGSVAQLTTFGRQPVQLAVGAKYYVASPDGGPDWAVRFSIVFLFPK